MRALLAMLVLSLLAGCAAPAIEPSSPGWRLGPPLLDASGHSSGGGGTCHPWGAWHAQGTFAAVRAAVRSGATQDLQPPPPPSLPLRVEAVDRAWNGPTLTRVEAERVVNGTDTTLALGPSGMNGTYVLSAIFPHDFTESDVREWFHGQATTIGLPQGTARQEWADRLVAAREPGMEMGATGRGTWIVSDTARISIRGPLDLEGAYARAAGATEGVVQSVGEGAWLTFTTTEARLVLEFALPTIHVAPGAGIQVKIYGSDWSVVWSPDAPPDAVKDRQKAITGAFVAEGLPEPRFVDWVTLHQDC